MLLIVASVSEASDKKGKFKVTSKFNLIDLLKCFEYEVRLIKVSSWFAVGAPTCLFP